MMNDDAFCFLKECAFAQKGITQRQLALRCSKALGTVNKGMQSLRKEGLITQANQVSLKGMELLERHRVKRAIVLLDRFEPRMLPAALICPAALISIGGKRVIDTILEALEAAQIFEIYIVYGIHEDMIRPLADRNPYIRLIKNPDYKEDDSISSLYWVREYLKNAYVINGNVCLKRADIIEPFQLATNFAVYPTQRDDGWCVQTNGKEIINLKLGNTNCHHLLGISYWNEKDGRQLAEDLDNIRQSPGGRKRRWEEVPLHYCKKHYRIQVRTCDPDDVWEIDSYRKLSQFDKAYE